MIATELSRWGIVHRNAEFYTNKPAWIRWYLDTLDHMQEIKELRESRNPLECYYKIRTYLAENPTP